MWRGHSALETKATLATRLSPQLPPIRLVQHLCKKIPRPDQTVKPPQKDQLHESRLVLDAARTAAPNAQSRRELERQRWNCA